MGNILAVLFFAYLYIVLYILSSNPTYASLSYVSGIPKFISQLYPTPETCSLCKKLVFDLIDLGLRELLVRLETDPVSLHLSAYKIQWIAFLGFRYASSIFHF